MYYTSKVHQKFSDDRHLKKAIILKLTHRTFLLQKESSYQSVIGAFQWTITIGRFEIITAVMTMPGLRIAPTQGHLDRLMIIYGYLSKMRHAALNVQTEELDYSNVSNLNHDWSCSVYGNLKEILPVNAPESPYKYVTFTHYVDAHATGVLHMVWSWLQLAFSLCR